MKKPALISLLMCTFLLFASVSNAQSILNRIGKKIKEKVEQKTEEQVEEEVEQTIGDIFEKDSTDEAGNNEKQPDNINSILKGIGMSGEPTPIENSYQFESKIQMHIETYNSDGEMESNGDLITWISPDINNFAYEFISGDIENAGKGTFIMDIENQAMIILSEENGNTSGIVYGFDTSNPTYSNNGSYEDLNNESTPNINANPYITKTGKTKTIEGCSCDEYTYDNPEEEVEGIFWISEDANIRTRDLMGTILKSASYSSGMPWGFIMESESTNKNTNERSLMKVTDLDNNANKTFKLNEYQITNLGSMSIPNIEQ